MAKTYSSGIVTAYGAAVRGGYTGTYEEFCAQQAAFAENAEQVSEDRAAVEQIKNTFENQTVPAAVQQVAQAGAAQVQAVQDAGSAEERDIATAGAAQEARVLQAGSEQAEAVNAAGSTQVGAVQTAGAAQVTAVQAAGSTQVADVNAAGATQVQAVEDKGEEVLASIPLDYSDLSGEVDVLAANLFAYAIASGEIVSFPDGAADAPVKEMAVSIELMQAGSGDPSPSNVRPITGWTSAKVTRTGKNLFDKNDPDVLHGYAVSATSGTVYIVSSGIWSASGFIPVEGRKNYVVSGDDAASDLAFYDGNKVFISGVTDGRYPTTAPANARYARIDYTIANENSIQFEQSSAATAYEPYQGDVYTVTFPSEAGTVCCGALNVTTGKLRSEWLMCDGGDLDWVKVSNSNFRNFYAQGPDVLFYANDVSSILSSAYKSTNNNASSASDDLYVWATALQPNNVISVKDTSKGSMTAEEFKAAMAGVQFLCKRSTPVEFELTPIEVKTLLGQNTIWADCGNIEKLIYRTLPSKETNVIDPENYKTTQVASWLTVGLPILYLHGITDGMSKDNAIDLNYEFEGSSGTCSVKWQGASSQNYPKKNYTVKFDNDIDVGWGGHKKYCFKANYIDNTSALNILGAKLWAQIVADRGGNPAIENAPNNGAMDGFPVILMLNDEFHGLYTWNIPKDKWAFGMGDAATQYIVTAEQHSQATQFRATSELAGDDFELEYAADDVEARTVKTALNTMLSAAMNANASGWENSLSSFLDLGNVIDYYIFSALIANGDGIDKNYILTSYNGTKWFLNAYDLDSILGSAWTGGYYNAANQGLTFAAIASTSHLFDLVYRFNKSALIQRYNTLRNGILSDANLQNVLYNFAVRIPKDIVDLDNQKWFLKPNTYTGTLARAVSWYQMRLKFIDAEIQSMQS